MLATRSLINSELFSRVSMFLAILSGSVIALALIAEADRFGPTFVSIAILLLAVDLFVGITTLSRLVVLNRDDFHSVIGMNRLRRAYLERHPELEQYFISGSYDDLPGVFQTMGVAVTPGGGFRTAFHGIRTLPGTLTVIVGAVAGALVGLILVAFSVPQPVVIVAAGLVFVVFVVVVSLWRQISFFRFTSHVNVRFPRPKER